MRFQVGSVSALASWHDFAFMKNFETVSLPCPKRALKGEAQRRLRGNRQEGALRRPSGTRFSERAPSKPPGNPFLWCSAHGDHAQVLHRGVSRAVSLKMHVGTTPSGPGPFPKNSKCLAVDHRSMLYRDLGHYYSAESSARNILMRDIRVGATGGRPLICVREQQTDMARIQFSIVTSQHL
jgi:hypothetical protein